MSGRLGELLSSSVPCKRRAAARRPTVYAPAARRLRDRRFKNPCHIRRAASCQTGISRRRPRAQETGVSATRRVLSGRRLGRAHASGRIGARSRDRESPPACPCQFPVLGWRGGRVPSSGGGSSAMESLPSRTRARRVRNYAMARHVPLTALLPAALPTGFAVGVLLQPTDSGPQVSIAHATDQQVLPYPLVAWVRLRALQPSL